MSAAGGGTGHEVWVDLGGFTGETIHKVVSDEDCIIDLLKAIFPEGNQYFLIEMRVYKSDGTPYTLQEQFEEKIVDCVLGAGHGNREKPLKITVPSMLHIGLPPLVPYNSRPASSSCSNHLDAEFEVSEIEILEQDRHPEIIHVSCLWREATMSSESLRRDRTCLNYSSLYSLIWKVRCVLVDIQFEGGICDMDCFNKSRLFQRKEDVLMVYAFNHPVGVIKVKKPWREGQEDRRNWDPECRVSDKNVMNNKKIIGQLFDYMSHLKVYAGTQHPFGILTTYDEWRLFWLPDTNAVAKSTTVQQEYANCPADLLKESTKYSADLPEDPPNWDQVFTETSHTTEPIDIPRKVHTSEVYKFDSHDLPRILLSTMRRLKSSPVSPSGVSTLSLVPEQPYMYVTQKTMEWKYVSKKMPLTNEGTIQASRVECAYLLADLGGGGDGKVWLASTAKGKVCAIKFASDKAMLEKEAMIWNKAWPFTNVQVSELNSKPALIMPWVKPCNAEGWKPEEMKAIREAVETLAKAGYKHEDLYPRHVGFYMKDSKLKALLFDLARTSDVAEPDQEIAIKEMLKELFD